MNEYLEELIARLPEPDMELSEANIRKIKRLIPVPNDYKILWADILSFGGYPAGIVITEEALIIKSTKETVKAINKEIKNNISKTDKPEHEKKIKTIYQIIPWEFYSPEEYQISIRKDRDNRIRYFLRAGETDLAEFRSPALYGLFQEFNTNAIEAQRKAEETLTNTTISSINSINAEGTLFNATYGAEQTKAGHGIYAEEAGAILDVLYGEQSTVVGRDNARNGPDKIVNTVPVQCKYCKTAASSVNSCFAKDATGGKTFRYWDLNGNPMKIEVPADQYTQAIDYMKNRIKDGQVPGVTDPNVAYDIIRKGNLTYSQALNLAKAGTVESIAFDAVTGAVTCLSALGISAVVSFAQVYWTTKDYKKAAKCALLTGLKVYGLTFAASIISSQLSRSAASNVLMPFAKNVVEQMNPQTVHQIINAFRSLAGKKAIYGAAAQKSLIRFLGSNAITEGVLLIAFSIPDIYRVLDGKISGAQYVKNMVSIVNSFVGSIGSTVLTGALLGAKGGEKVKKIGPIIGCAAGAAGGFVAGTATKVVADLIHEDDAIISTRMINAITANLLIEYMLSEIEQNQLIEMLNNEEKELTKLQRGLLKSPNQGKHIEDFLRPKLDGIVRSRGRITSENMYDNINNIITDGGLTDGV